MSYWVNHLMGDSETDYELSKLEDLYNELIGSDSEHPDVSLTHETEWTLSAFKSGLLIWKNLDSDDEPMHMKSVSPEKVISLWTLLAHGDITAVDRENWLPGYGN